MESDLHIAMKKAVLNQLAAGKYVKREVQVLGTGRGSLRVDVRYCRRNRDYLVECETRPTIKRLICKAKRRNKIKYPNVYILVIPDYEYPKQNWGQLRGYFDKIYIISDGVLHLRMDLRTLGPIQDIAQDIIQPTIQLVEKFRGRWRKRPPLWSLMFCLRCITDNPKPGSSCKNVNCPINERKWLYFDLTERYIHIARLRRYNNQH